MKKSMILGFALSIGLAVAVCAPAMAAPIFSDDFSAAALNPAMATFGGAWAVTDGVLAQSDVAKGDPKKAIVVIQDLPADLQVTAKVRVDAWVKGDYSRAGVSLRSNVKDGQGYNLLFHDDQLRVQFLDDAKAWGKTNFPFTWETGVWYWFKLKNEGNILSGKVWKVGTDEPTDWPFTEKGWKLTRVGYPAMNGGSSDGKVAATASFDDLSISAPEL